MDEPTTKLPANLLFVAEQLSHYNRNRFKIEPTGSSEAKAGQIVTINLPENCLLDSASIRFHFDADAGKATDIAGLLPENADAFIGNLEVYVNGIQVQQSAQEYNTIAHALRLGGKSQDNQQTKGRLVNHSAVYADASNTPLGIVPGTTGEKASLVIDEWCGFLNQVSTRFINTQILGNIQIRLTLASNAVLSGCTIAEKANDVAIDTASTAGKIPAYTLSNMWFSVDSIVVPDAYNQLLRNQLSQSVLPLNYNEYYTFTSPDSNSSSEHISNRFSLAAGSIDKLLALNRLADYNTFGAATKIEGNSPLENIGNALVGKYFTSSSFKKTGEYDHLDGSLRWSWNVNNVKYPQYDATNSEAMADVAYSCDKVGIHADGVLISSPSAFCRGLAVYSLQLNHPGLGLKCQSGYNSRGINSTLGFNMTGLRASAKNNIIIAVTTAQMRISAGKSVAISF